MFKNLVIALGIAALTSTSAFAAAKAPKTTAHASRKVAQAAEVKPAHVDTKTGKAGKKMKVENKTVKPAETPVAPTKK
jgi:hypothetical protein